MSCVKTLPLLIGLGIFLLGANAHALPEDRNQPIRVQAVYRGDVVITQGTMKITGDTVTITQNKNGDVEVFTSIGKPAYYEQKPAADKEIVKAYGLTIQYFAANERIVLIDQAKVVQEGNTFEGEKIVYDTQRQIVNAGRATNTDVTTPRPRVDMVIQPRKKEQATEQPE